ncbi:hypothetical protein KIW84_075084 [Lathyrus oleraceus]|uniref:Uncharacterized protein n=1 Tax=Pisum sativum TaxID=3888 RepID=A0A9D4VSU3_PEA|nr:hypothetical protein KIW84_075084 [Pisum sativum]
MDDLVKSLKTCHVPQEISVCQFKGVVNNIVLSRVLVDFGYSLNVMPKGSLAKLTIEELVVKPSELVVRASYGSRRTVIGEEDIVASHLASFHYVEEEGEMKEIMFQSFEVFNVEMVCLTRDESKNTEFTITSLQDALTIIKNGHPQGWGRILEFPNNKDRLGLGNNS